jgi:hypothetical protein
MGITKPTGLVIRIAKCRRLRLVAAALAVAGLAACQVKSAMERRSIADSLARLTLEELRAGGLEDIRQFLALETAQTPGIEEEVAKMRAALPPGPPDTVALVASETVLDGRKAVTKLRYVIRNDLGAAEADVWVEQEGSVPRVETLRVSALRLP